MSTITPAVLRTAAFKKTGARQRAVLRHLDRHGPTDLDALAEKIFGSYLKRGEARKSIKALEARGLVEIERDEKGEVHLISLVTE